MLSLLSLLLLVPAVLSSPYIKIRESPISIPIAASLNFTGFRTILEADQKRAQSLIHAAKLRQNGKPKGANPTASGGNVPVTNSAVTYVAKVGVGSPATQYSLIVDTGSSNTWVGAGAAYKRTSTSTQTSDSVSVTYGSGSFSGTEFIDQVTLSSSLVIQKQSIGVASTSTGFQGVDGILGIGPTDLTVGTLSPGTSTSIPTVTDNLHSQGTIPSDMIGISFEPTTSQSVTNGQLTFGGTDSTKFTGSITFTPITRTSPSSQFWGINQNLRYGASTTILSGNAGIVDTGTTLVLLTTTAFKKYQTATGGVLDNATGLLKITSTQFQNLKSLFFVVGTTTFEFTANAQIWPRALNTFIGGTAGSIYLIVGDLGSSTGLDFINGYTFLERFYSVYDTTNHRVGLATTPFTTATTN